MSDVTIKPAWRLHDPTIEHDSIAFWKRWNLLPPGTDAHARVKELVAAAYQGDQVVGLSTAVLGSLPALRETFAVYRSAVSPENRRQGIGEELLLASHALLERWSYENPQEKVMGLAMEVETDLGHRNSEPFWPEGNLMIAGYTTRGFPLRLTWFAHARVD